MRAQSRVQKNPKVYQRGFQNAHQLGLACKNLRTNEMSSPKGILMRLNKTSLGLQIPSKKVLKLLKTPQSTFLEGIWSPRAYQNLTTPFDLDNPPVVLAVATLNPSIIVTLKWNEEQTWSGGTAFSGLPPRQDWEVRNNKRNVVKCCKNMFLLMIWGHAAGLICRLSPPFFNGFCG